jgi:hypothetical protein
MEWLHETFGKRNVVEKRFPWNAKKVDILFLAMHNAVR